MQIACPCGNTVRDNIDFHPWKAHLVPDTDCFLKPEAVVVEMLLPLAEGKVDVAEAKSRLYDLSLNWSRMMWQCWECGRLFIADKNRGVRCFVPDGEPDKGILRGVKSD